MANLTYTQIFSMTQDEIHDVVAINMENGDHDDTISINEKLNAIEAVRQARKDAYPKLEEQLDMQYWDSVNGTTTWKDKVAEIKAAHPFPTD
jgi:hypothetical protein